jgi:hypothetical protein
LGIIEVSKEVTVLLRKMRLTGLNQPKKRDGAGIQPWDWLEGSFPLCFDFIRDLSSLLEAGGICPEWDHPMCLHCVILL